jgi:hypothetical protein
MLSWRDHRLLQRQGLARPRDMRWSICQVRHRGRTAKVHPWRLSVLGDHRSGDWKNVSVKPSIRLDIHDFTEDLAGQLSTICMTFLLSLGQLGGDIGRFGLWYGIGDLGYRSELLDTDLMVDHE